MNSFCADSSQQWAHKIRWSLIRDIRLMGKYKQIAEGAGNSCWEWREGRKKVGKETFHREVNLSWTSKDENDCVRHRIQPQVRYHRGWDHLWQVALWLELHGLGRKWCWKSGLGLYWGDFKCQVREYIIYSMHSRKPLKVCLRRGVKYS